MLGEIVRLYQAVLGLALGTTRKFAIQPWQIILPWVRVWVVRAVSYGLPIFSNLTRGAARTVLILGSPSSNFKVYMTFLAYAPLGAISLTMFSQTFSPVARALNSDRRYPPPRMILHYHFEILRMHRLGALSLFCWGMVTLVLWKPYWEIAMIGVVMMLIALWKKWYLASITPSTPAERVIWALEEYPFIYLESTIALQVAHARVVERMHDAKFYSTLKRLAERGEVDLALVHPDWTNAMKGLTAHIRIADATDTMKKALANYRKAEKYDSMVYQPGDEERIERREFQLEETMQNIITLAGKYRYSLTTYRLELVY